MVKATLVLEGGANRGLSDGKGHVYVQCDRRIGRCV